MPSFYALMGIEPSFDPDRGFVTSWLLPPIGLAFLRTLFALFCWINLFACFGYDGIRTPTTIGAQFSYFTNLAWWGITLYMTIAAVHTWIYHRRGYTWLDQWPRFLQLLHSLFYTTIVTYPFLVSIVYWTILYKSPWFPVKFNAYRNISRHLLNTVMAIFEIILPTTKQPPWLHVFFLIFILALYLPLVYITYETQGFYAYEFLNPENGQLAGAIIGTAVAIVFIFILVWIIIRLRKRWTGIGKGSRRDKGFDQMAFQTNDIEIVLKYQI